MVMSIHQKRVREWAPHHRCGMVPDGDASLVIAEQLTELQPLRQVGCGLP
jgi:hypothetical protein